MGFNLFCLANSNQRPKKNEAKPMLSLAEAREAAKENDEPEKVLPQSAKGQFASAPCFCWKGGLNSVYVIMSYVMKIETTRNIIFTLHSR